LEKSEALTDEERQQINAHPFFALEHLDRVRGLDEKIVLAVYQEHESPDRQGYPNKRPAFLIHDYAKIIAICDSYDAMTAARPYRTPLTPYRAVEELVQLAAKLRYDPRIMRAFLRLIGLFPIGSWVKLSNGEYARVIGGNYDTYDRPQICTMFKDNPNLKALVGETTSRIDPNRVINLDQRPDLKIVETADNKFDVGPTGGF
jgi:HD-GYP domain-containing protein (c-di-GMP phosphodiesterase class II)